MYQQGDHLSHLENQQWEYSAKHELFASATLCEEQLLLK